jgi:hypothetical protein
MTAQQLMRNGLTVRALYGIFALFLPNVLFKLSGKPVEDEPRYFNALFGGRDLSVTAASVAAIKAGRTADAVKLNMSCEATDTISLLQEVRARGGFDQTLVAGLAFNIGGWATWIAASRRL